MKRPITSSLFAAAMLALGSCTAQDAPPAAAPAGVRPTSFAEVTRQLDPGGTLYGYLATDRWLEGLSTNLLQIRQLLTSLPEMRNSGDREQVERVFDLIGRAVKQSGVEAISGVGVSSLQLTPELFRTKFVVQRRQDAGDGLLWTVLGRQPHPLRGLDLLPATTALAAFGDLDARALWQVLDRELRQCGIPEVVEGVVNWPKIFEEHTELTWDRLLGSLGGEFGLALTLDDSQPMALPIPGQRIEIGTPGLLIIARVNDDLLFDRLSTELRKNPETQVVTEPGLKMCSMPIPLPIPMPVEVTVASSAGYCFLASSPALVRAAVAVREGKQTGLRGSDEVQALLKHLPTQGNNFAYVSRRLGGTFFAIQRQLLKSGAVPAEPAALMEKLMAGQTPGYGLSVGANTPTGWLDVSVGNQDSAVAVLVLPVAPVAISAGMLLPALAKAKSKAQSISCVNNLKQIGLAYRLWSTDNEDQFPFNVSTNKGGSKEFVSLGPDGFDRNAYRHFMVLSNELSTPKVLVCVADTSKQPAADFPTFGPANLSYQLRTGPNVNETHPAEVLARCPIHGNEVMCDGSVRQPNRK